MSFCRLHSLLYQISNFIIIGNNIFEKTLFLIIFVQFVEKSSKTKILNYVTILNNNFLVLPNRI